MNKKLTCDFELKNITSEDDYYTFEGYASTFGNVDQGGDKVMKGAFTKSLNKIKESGVIIPVLWQHDQSIPVGVYTHLQEDAKGLYVAAKMPKDDTFVRDRIIPQLKIRSIGKMSIGYRINKNGSSYKGGVHELKDLDLKEISLVTFPMNTEADITAIKQQQEEEKKLNILNKYLDDILNKF